MDRLCYPVDISLYIGVSNRSSLTDQVLNRSSLTDQVPNRSSLFRLKMISSTSRIVNLQVFYIELKRSDATGVLKVRYFTNI